MAAIAPISIVDGQSTPVTHVFNPVTSVPPTYRRNGVAGQAVIAQEMIVTNVKLAKQADGVNIVTIGFAIPVSEVPSGASSSGYVAPPAIAHTMRGKFEFFLHNRSEAVGRRDLRVLGSNLLKDPQIIALIDQLEQPY